MHTYFTKGSYLVVKKAKTATFCENSLRTLGPKICNSPPKDVKDFKHLQNSLKHGSDLNANATSANTRVTHITILELHTLA